MFFFLVLQKSKTPEPKKEPEREQKPVTPVDNNPHTDDQKSEAN